MVRPDEQPPPSASQPLLEPAPQMRIVAEARRRRTRRIVLVVLLGAALVFAAIVGTLWIDYSSARRSLVSRTAADGALRSALATPSAGSVDGDVLVVLRSLGGEATSPTTAVLLRVSERAERAWVLALPGDATLGAPGSGVGTVGDVLAVDGRAGLVRAVSARSGRPVASYLEFDPAAVGASLDATAAAASVPPSEKLLSALRAVGSASGVWDTTKMRLRLASALAPRAVSTLSLDRLTELAESLQAVGSRVETADAPAITIKGARVVDEASLRTLAAQMHAGKGFSVAGAQQVESVKPSSVSVTVWNGAGIAGIAADAADRLSRAGYKVTVVTNANQFVYDSTLVVYRQGKEAAARRAALDLRAGRVVPRRGMYLFDTDLLVVVGKDWPAVR